MNSKVLASFLALSLSFLVVGCAEDEPEQASGTSLISSKTIGPNGDSNDPVRVRFQGINVNTQEDPSAEPYGVVLLNNDTGLMGRQDDYKIFTYHAELVSHLGDLVSEDPLGCPEGSEMRYELFDVSATLDEEEGEIDAIYIEGSCGMYAYDCLIFFTNDLLSDFQSHDLPETFFITAFSGMNGGCDVSESQIQQMQTSFK